MNGATDSDSYFGATGGGENEIPGSGGNLNSVFSGYGEVEREAGDYGYQVGSFPAGSMPRGGETQEFRISDSDAFNNLRGIAKTSYPFDPYVTNDSPDGATTLADRFEQSRLAGASSLMPGKFSYNRTAGELGAEILESFSTGTSTFNSGRNAASIFGGQPYDDGRVFGQHDAEVSALLADPLQQEIGHSSIPEAYAKANSTQGENALPITPFSKTYPNFGSGAPSYGFNEPGSETMDADILRAYSAVLPEGQLAGAKQDLMPVFSGVNALAVEQRPILQSLGKQRNTLYLGGLTSLPDDLTIDPREALHSDSNVPANLVQTAGELASALQSMERGDTSSRSGAAYGQALPNNRMLAGSDAGDPSGLYDYLTTASAEPLLYGHGSGAYLSSGDAVGSVF